MKNKELDKLFAHIGEYMKTKGWNIIVISSPVVTQEPNDLVYNYILSFKFTGIQKENKKGQATPQGIQAP